MNTETNSWVEVRGVRIGEGIPKICVPIVGKTRNEILAAAESFESVKKDVVEWRADWFDGVFDFAQVEAVLKELRRCLEIPQSFLPSGPQMRAEKRQLSRLLMPS